MTTFLFRSSSKVSSRSLRGLLGSVSAGITGGLFVLALLAAPLSAQPTSFTDADSAPTTWKAHYGEQAALMLRSNNQEKQSLTLQTLIRITSEGRTVDLSAAVPALYEVYENDSNLNHRIMAASVLQQVAGRLADGDQMMRRLGALVAEQSSYRVQRITLLMLVDYETERGRLLRVSPVLYDLVMSWGRA